MKTFFLVFAFALFLAFPLQIHASGLIGGAMTAGVLQAILANDIAHYATVVASWVQEAVDAATQIEHLYNQLEHLKRNEERYLKNLRGIMDIRSFNDFMSWFNRSTYIARESERIFNTMGVKIGGKYYDLTEIDEIPGNIRNDYFDRHWGDFSEEEKYKVYTKMGLAPSNYMYLKTWQERNEEIKKRLLTSREMHADEMEEAAVRNNNLLSDYSTSNEEIDSNTIAKNSGASLAQIEMQLREIGLTMDDFMAYTVTRDNEKNTPPTPPMPHRGFNDPVFSPIANGKSNSSYEDL